MDIQTHLPKVKELLDKAKEVLIVTHENPTHDSVGSTLALYLGLIGLGKKVVVACPDAITVELSSYVGAQKIITDLSNKNFVVSLDYVDGSIEKVSYNIEGDKFNLVIEPRVGFESFSQDKVHYSYAGSNADLVFAVDTIGLGAMKKLYEADKNLFASKPIVNIDHQLANTNFGQINIVDTHAATTIELIAQILSGLGVKLTPDIATNILNAVYAATDNFAAPTVTPLALELAATCLRSGGRRFGVYGPVSFTGTAQTQSMRVSAVPMQNQPSRPAQPKPFPSVPSQGFPVSSAQPVGLPIAAVQSIPAQQSAPTVQAPSTSFPRADSGQAGQTGQQTPSDWLKPKIFKSSSNIS